MGINQLLPFLEKSTRPCNVSEFKGQTVAVDSYCWLHKAARSCAMQLARGEDTTLYLNYCMKLVKMLLNLDVKPIMVFDGSKLPAKLGTETQRREIKKLARRQGMECLRLGRTQEANKFFAQCVDITPEMARSLIRECRNINVDCIVAPYEADAQLAFFSRENLAQCVITEDSDLLVFGCDKVLYKMDVNGDGQLVEADKMYNSMKIRRDQYTFDKFRHMCILAGCDYLDSLPGIGLKKALKFITMTAETNPAIFIERIPRYLNFKNLSVPETYKEQFLIADATFKHQLVYDPINKRLIPLNPVKEGDVQYCQKAGDYFDRSTALQLAIGNLNPLTGEKFDDWDFNKLACDNSSIWSPFYVPRGQTPKTAVPKTPKKIPHPVSDLGALEQAKDKCDEQMRRELKFYETTSPKIVPDYSQKADIETKTSPILNNNPFLKKGLSKFSATETSYVQVVASRFFSSAAPTAYRDKHSFASCSSSQTNESGFEEEQGNLKVTPEAEDTWSECDLSCSCCYDDDDEAREWPDVGYECTMEVEDIELRFSPKDQKMEEEMSVAIGNFSLKDALANTQNGSKEMEADLHGSKETEAELNGSNETEAELQFDPLCSKVEGCHNVPKNILLAIDNFPQAGSSIQNVAKTAPSRKRSGKQMTIPEAFKRLKFE